MEETEVVQEAPAMGTAASVASMPEDDIAFLAEDKAAEAAAIETFAAGRKAAAAAAEAVAPAPVAEPPVVEPPAAVPVPVPNPLAQPAAPAVDPDEAKFLARLERVRAQEQSNLLAQQERAELERLRAREVALKTKPRQALAELGLTEAALTDLILNGNEAPVQPHIKALEDKLAAMEARQRELDEQSTRNAAQAQIQAFKVGIPQQIAAKQGDFPYLMGVFTPAEMSDHVWNIIDQTHRVEGTVLTVEQASSVLEAELARQAARFSKVALKPTQSATPGPVAARPAANAALTTRSVTSSTTPAADIDELDENALHERAVATLKAAAKAAEAAKG